MRPYRPSGRIYLYPDGARSYLPGCPFTRGTVLDLEEEGITPKPGMRLEFYVDDANEKNEIDCMLFTGVIDCDQATGEWFAVLDKDSFCHESDWPIVRATSRSCAGYGVGAYDTLSYVGKICPPIDADVQQIHYIVVKYLMDHPELRHLGGAEISWAALAAAFPCH